MGGLLDFWGDNVVHGAVFLAIAVEWWHRTGREFPFLLAGLAILSALGTAGLIYWRTMRPEKCENGPLFTSLFSSTQKNKTERAADFLTRRDFIYLVVILSFFNHLDWFLILSAIGTPVFFLVVLFLNIREDGR
jgi:hypothetical protein